MSVGKIKVHLVFPFSAVAWSQFVSGRFAVGYCVDLDGSSVLLRWLDLYILDLCWSGERVSVGKIKVHLAFSFSVPGSFTVWLQWLCCGQPAGQFRSKVGGLDHWSRLGRFSGLVWPVHRSRLAGYIFVIVVLQL